MNKTNTVWSLAAKVKVIHSMLSGISIKCTREEVRRHCERQQKGVEKFDFHFPGWFRHFEPGEIDFRRQPLRAPSKLPFDVLKEKPLGIDGVDFTSEVGQECGLVVLDSMDLCEAATLTYAWNAEIAERNRLDYGPFQFADRVVV